LPEKTRPSGDPARQVISFDKAAGFFPATLSDRHSM